MLEKYRGLGLGMCTLFGALARQQLTRELKPLALSILAVTETPPTRGRRDGFGKGKWIYHDEEGTISPTWKGWGLPSLPMQDPQYDTIKLCHQESRQQSPHKSRSFADCCSICSY